MDTDETEGDEGDFISNREKTPESTESSEGTSQGRRCKDRNNVEGTTPSPSSGGDKREAGSPPKRSSHSPWEHLGIPVGSNQGVIRKAFLEKARKLHPDHGGDADEFQRMYQAYETLREKGSGRDGGNDGDGSRGGGDDGDVDNEVLWEWLRWAGRWGKRMLNQHDGEQKEVLRIKVPWKLLEDRSISVKIEYDGWPLRIPLGRNETVGPGGLLVRLLPIAEWKEETEADKNESGSIHKCDEPWIRGHEWFYEVPWNATMFRVGGSGDGAGEWSGEPGVYGRGVRWSRLCKPVDTD
jgi:hypothetical protein